MIIIPARLASSRFPRKLLQPIAGIPMIVRVAKQAEKVDSVVVACDSDEVFNICQESGIKAVMTSKEHTSGTDRLAEAARILGLSDDEVIINVQGDEPFIEPEVILSLKNSIKRAIASGENPFMASVYKKISQEESLDPNLVKVVVDKNSYALYFSRAKIPYLRDEADSFRVRYYGHLGLYAYTGKSLEEFCKLPTSMLEETEKLEQLRALENGYKILMSEANTQSFGIDTPEDLKRAIRIFKDRF
ncbi:MAG: 3-deoxy-manno-octulosonate cytidylyltransferase [Wolinella sp.]